MKNRYAAALIVLLLSAVTVIIAVGLLFPDVFPVLVREDGFAETLTALVLFLSALLLIARAFRSGRSRLFMVFHLVLAAGLLFGAGEEISWGQRIFDFESGAFFREHNTQQEANLHNLEFAGIRVNRIVFTYGLIAVFGLYFLLTGWLYRRRASFRSLSGRIGLPVPRAGQVFAFAAGTVLILLIPDERKWEAWELLFSVTILWILLFPLNAEDMASG